MYSFSIYLKEPENIADCSLNIQILIILLLILQADRDPLFCVVMEALFLLEEECVAKSSAFLSISVFSGVTAANHLPPTKYMHYG